jgi:hypothetical protein
LDLLPVVLVRGVEPQLLKANYIETQVHLPKVEETVEFRETREAA